MSGHQEYKCSSCGFEWESLEVYNGCPRCKHGQINAPIPSELTQLRADNARLNIELKEARCATDFANLACDRKDEEIVRWREKYQEEYRIVDRVWKALGITSYYHAHPNAIWEHVTKLNSTPAHQSRLA